MEKKNWFVYILECNDGSYYTGVTNDIKNRMKTHEEGNGSKYVRSRGFKKLLFKKNCFLKSKACRQEYKIKQLPKKKKLEWFK